jgi:hypothetical protein
LELSAQAWFSAGSCRPDFCPSLGAPSSASGPAAIDDSFWRIGERASLLDLIHKPRSDFVIHLTAGIIGEAGSADPRANIRRHVMNGKLSVYAPVPVSQIPAFTQKSRPTNILL